MTKADVIDLDRTVQEHGDAEYLRGYQDGYKRAMQDVNENRGERLAKARTSEELFEALKQ